MSLALITHIFMWLLQQSILASILIVFVLIIRRLLMQKVSIQWIYGLWILVILKLIVPINIESSISVLNILKPISMNIIHNSYNPIQQSIFYKNSNQLTELDSNINLNSNPSNKLSNNKLNNDKLNSNKLDKNLNVNLSTNEKAEVKPIKNNKSKYIHKIKGIPAKRDFIYLSYIKDMTGNISVINIISVIWLIGAVIGLAMMFISRKKFEKSINSVGCVTDKNIIDVFNMCKELLRIDKDLHVKRHYALKTPAIFGVINPVVILPKDIIRQIDNEALKYIFFHELSHYKRKDVVINYIVNVLKCIYWFNPLVWYSFIKMHEDREVSCDAMALSYIDENERISYGQTIIDILKINSKGFNIVGAEGMINKKSSIVRRINMIKNSNNIVYHITVKGVISTLVLSGLLLTVPKATIQAVSNTNNLKTASKVAISKNGIITFADKNIEKAVRKAINKPTGNITKQDALKVKELSIGNPGTGRQKISISSLDGIENFENLMDLSLVSYQLNNIDAISKLHNLQKLDLTGSKLNNINAISKLNKLQTLILNQTGISDLKPLKGLTNIKYLNLSCNKISDISPLKNMTNLNALYVDTNNKLKDISVVKNFSKLQTLIIAGTAIRDINALKNLTNLIELDCRVNKVSDINALKKLTKLQKLSFFNNSITNIDSIKNLTSLKELELSNVKMENIKPLSNLNKLETLVLSDDNIKDINPISKLSNIQQLTLHSNKIKNLDGLKNLNNLAYLNVKANNISDIKGLSKLSKVGMMELDAINVSDISPLKGMSNLQSLSVNSKKLTDISVFTKLPYLRDLLVCSDELSNLNQIARMTSLRTLWVESNKLSDISALNSLRYIGELTICSDKLSNLEPISKLSNLQSLTLKGKNISDLNPLNSLNSLLFLSISDAKNVDLNGIGKLKKITSISLKNIDIDKNKINVLENMKSLSEICLTKDKVNSDNIDKLKIAIPKCSIKIVDKK